MTLNKSSKILIIICILMFLLSVIIMVTASAYYTPLPTSTYTNYVIIRYETTNMLIYSQNQMTIVETNLTSSGTPVQYTTSTGEGTWATLTNQSSYSVSATSWQYVTSNYEIVGYGNPEPSPSPSPSEEVIPSSSPSPLPEGGFKEIIQPLIGDYVPSVTQKITVVDDGTTTTTTTEEIVIPDYIWFVGPIMISISLYSVFRLLGGIFSGGVKKWQK